MSIARVDLVWIWQEDRQEGWITVPAQDVRQRKRVPRERTFVAPGRVAKDGFRCTYPPSYSGTISSTVYANPHAQRHRHALVFRTCPLNCPAQVVFDSSSKFFANQCQRALTLVESVVSSSCLPCGARNSATLGSARPKARREWQRKCMAGCWRQMERLFRVKVGNERRSD